LLSKRLDLEMSLRGVLRGFGLKVGSTTPRTFAGRVRELAKGQATLEAIAEAMLKARDALIKEDKGLESQILKQSLSRRAGPAADDDARRWRSDSVGLRRRR
jgi:hypothetical protein